MRYYLLLIVLVIQNSFGFAQVHEIRLAGRDSHVNDRRKDNGIDFNFSQEKILTTEKISNEGQSYTEIWFKGSFPTGEIGSPKLPVYKKLIRIPRGSKPIVRVKSYTQQVINLKDKGLKNPIIPNQPSLRKDQDSTKIKFQVKKEAYLKNSYSNPPLAKVEILGNLRSATIARLVISPVDYNPVNGSIKVYNNIDVSVDFENINLKEEKDQISKTSSPYFDFIYQAYTGVLNSTYDTHPDLTKYPVKMLIISNRMFEQTLQPFIEWKKLKGFNVITAYTDVIGTSADQIKTYIQQQYNSSTAEDPAPSFLVLVGDVAQLPESDYGSSTGSSTDLYYASIDGDMFPDMYYGRLSATTTDQLSYIINKLLYYEKYQFADPSYLNNVTLIAGVDGSWNYKVGQPTIKYSTANYFNSDHGFSLVNEYGVTTDPNNPSATPTYTGCYGNDRISVGLVNYTAHGSETSWVDPSLTKTTIAAFANANKYPLAIGNCCLSGDFGYTECLGEAWIRAQNKGAVTYIGSAPNTFWLEDFYWAVGAFPLVGENDGYVPTFEESTTGVYDAPYVSNYVTTGGMVFAGNLAVTEADIQGYNNSSSPIYYWQAYNVLGDPSLIPYLSEADANQINHNETITLGESLFKISTLAGSYIAITKDNQLIGTLYNNQTSEIDIPITPITTTGDVIIVVTRPQTIPYIDTITAISPTGPYLLLSSLSIDDNLMNNNGLADFNEDIAVNLKIKNIGIQNATNVKVKITGTDSNINLTSTDSISVADIPYNAGTNILDVPAAYSFTVHENIPDQYKTNFTIKFYSDQGTWSSKLKILLNSPVISIEEIQIDDSLTGNNDGYLNPGETCYASINVTNTGHATAKAILPEITVPDSLINVLTASTVETESFSIEPNTNFNTQFRLSSNPDYHKDIQLPISINLNVQEPTGQSNTFTKYIHLTPQDTARMSNDTIQTCFTYFYDSGGKLANYTNSENYITTFIAKTEFSNLRIKFLEFSTERGYDYLYVYDGADINAPQITGSPFSGSSLPSEILSSSRCVTFRFRSDDNTLSKGWVATIECVTPESIPFCAKSPVPNNNATLIQSGTLSWEKTQNASFYDVYIGLSLEKLGLTERVSKNNYTFNPEKNKTYYWRVAPGNYLGTNDSICETWGFSTDTICKQVVISNGATEVDTLYFYDSGGALSNYKNNENYTFTFKPKYLGNKIQIGFLNFSVESESTCNYDKLSIFNGLSTSSPLIGSYCGTNSPNTIESNNSDGAITFKFQSDYSETYSGWKAIVRSIGTTDHKTLTFTVKSNNIPVSNASVNIGGLIKITDQNGVVSFNVVAGNLNYVINADEYEKVSGSITVGTSNIEQTIELKKTHTINLYFTDASTHKPLAGVKIKYDTDSIYTNTDGSALIKLSSRTYNITASTTGYDTLIYSLVVVDDLINKELTLTPQNFKVAFSVMDLNGARIKDAIVDINNSIYYTDSDGILNSFLTWGSYFVTISKEGFFPLKMWILVNDTINKKIVLDRVVSLFDVEFTFYSSGPIDTALLDNIDIDLFYNQDLYSKLKTNSLGKSIIQLPRGTFFYDASREGYYSLVGKKLIVDGETYRKDTLIQKAYNVEFTFYGSGPKDTLLLENTDIKIFYNQKICAQLITDSQGRVTTSLPSGNFLYSANREGYNSIVDANYFVDGIHLSTIDTLTQQTFEVILNIKSSGIGVQDAKVTLGGYSPHNTNDLGIALFNGVGYEKNLSYLIQRSGYVDANGFINVIEPINLDINLISTSILENRNKQIKIFPNPTSNLLNIQSENSIIQIQIIDISGKIVENISYQDTFNTLISLDNLPKGVYLIAINFKNSSSFKSIVIKK